MVNSLEEKKRFSTINSALGPVEQAIQIILLSHITESCLRSIIFDDRRLTSELESENID